jgi:predicted DNA-binding transcriptional regulator AlpA
MNIRPSLTPLLELAAEQNLLQGFVTRPQLAEIYGVTPETICTWQARDGLPVHRIGTQPVYDRTEVDNWFRNRPNLLHGNGPASPEQEALLKDRRPKKREKPPIDLSVANANNRLLSENELSQYLGIARITLSRLRSLGDGPKYIRLGRRIVYVPLDVEQWLQSKKESIINRTPA